MAELNVRKAIYHSKDHLSNFKIKVTLHPRTSSLSTTDTNSGIEEYTFHWQEKRLSQREIHLYQDRENCKNKVHEKYHEDINKMKSKPGGLVTKRRIFSYVNWDDYSKSQEKVTTALSDKKTYLADQVNRLRGKMLAKKKEKDDADTPGKPVSVYSHQFTVIEEPTEEQKQQRHFLPPPLMVMYIMADLTGDITSTSVSGDNATTQQYNPDRDEQILCTILKESNGVISIRPDFNQGKKLYKVESASGRDYYTYTLTHVSNKLSTHEQEKERKIQKELYARHVQLVQSRINPHFDLAQDKDLRLFVFGEIVSAKNFDYNNLYIHFFVDLPRDWHAVAQCQLSSITQISQTKVVMGHYPNDRQEDVAFFGFPFEFEFFHREDPGRDKIEMRKWPIIYFEVLSVDRLTRFRSEGYGYVMIPSEAGQSTETVHCWRALGNTVISEMRRYFIGGTPELEDLTYAGIPSSFDGQYLGKVGVRTKATGSVQFKFNCVQQSSEILNRQDRLKNRRSNIDKFGLSSQPMGALDIIAKFNKTRENMIRIRENVAPKYLISGSHNE